MDWLLVKTLISSHSQPLIPAGHSPRPPRGTNINMTSQRCERTVFLAVPPIYNHSTQGTCPKLLRPPNLLDLSVFQTVDLAEPESEARIWLGKPCPELPPGEKGDGGDASFSALLQDHFLFRLFLILSAFYLGRLWQVSLI